jgi:hypothetical protein
LQVHETLLNKRGNWGTHVILRAVISKEYREEYRGSWKASSRVQVRDREGVGGACWTLVHRESENLGARTDVRDIRNIKDSMTCLLP